MGIRHRSEKSPEEGHDEKSSRHLAHISNDHSLWGTAGGPGRGYTGSGPAEAIEYSRTYLPDIRASEAESCGWNSSIVVRNDGRTSADISVTLYNQDGTVKDSRSVEELRVNGVWRLEVRELVFDPLVDLDPPYDKTFTGSAVVAGTGEVSVVVLQHHSAPEAWAAYSGVRLVVQEAHVPIVQKNNSGWYGQLFVQNSGTAQANLSVTFKS